MVTKDGVKVGVKEVNDEDYRDRTQRWVYYYFIFITNHFQIPTYPLSIYV